MASQPLTRLTPEEYLELDRHSDRKYEYWCVINNIQYALTHTLRGKNCGVFNADLRVSADAKRVWTYPDVTVVCGPPKYTGDKRDTISNPVLVVEGLSPSTARFDRGEKIQSYAQCPSVQGILLVDPQDIEVEHSWRLPDGHSETAYVTDRAAVLSLVGLDCALPVSEIYRELEFLTGA